MLVKYLPYKKTILTNINLFINFKKKIICLVEAEPKEPPSGPVPKAETPVHIREFLRNLGR